MAKFSRFQICQMIDGFDKLPCRNTREALVAAFTGAPNFEDVTLLLAMGEAFGSEGQRFLNYCKTWYSNNMTLELPTEKITSKIVVEIQNSEDANAIMFIMTTEKPLKLMLKILNNNISLKPTTVINLKDLLSEVSKLKNIAMPKGKLKRLQSIGKFSIFFFLFEEKTKCSVATETNFVNVDVPSAKIKLPVLFVKRNVAWAFFTLNPSLKDNLENYFEQSNGKTLKDSFIFPKPHYEDHRMSCLLSTIKGHYELDESTALAKIDRIEAKTQTDGCCQFSGGGDLCLNAKLETLVFNEMAGENVEGIPSPICKGTSASTTMSIEGKKDSCSYDKLKYQLFANMVVASVAKFIDKLEEYDEMSIVTIDRITGYGIAYTGFGDVGFFKLEMKFGEQTKVITKCELQQRPQQYAAALVDHLLDYFFDKLKLY